MIIELNEVTQRVVETCEKHHALDLEDETWTPMQKLRRIIDDSVHVLLNGREGLSYNLPHDAMIAMERQPLHTIMQNESPLAPDMLNVLLDVNTELVPTGTQCDAGQLRFCRANGGTYGREQSIYGSWRAHSALDQGERWRSTR